MIFIATKDDDKHLKANWQHKNEFDQSWEIPFRTKDPITIVSSNKFWQNCCVKKRNKEEKQTHPVVAWKARLLHPPPFFPTVISRNAPGFYGKKNQLPF